MRFSIALAAVLIAGGLPPAVGEPAGSPAVSLAALSPGDAAPPFTLKGSDGRTHRLSDYRGKQAVVLAWFAKAFTGG